MAFLNCNCNERCRCTIVELIVSAIVGVLTAFFQITGTIAVSTAFLWVVFGIAVVYLAALVIASALERRKEDGGCKCAALSALLAGILGTILTALVLLAFGITATSVISAIIVGLLLFFFALTVTATACLVRSLSDCAA